ncbi:putative DNA-binding domain-containing protein [Lysobacter sp. SG-8]|uniref:Putative DNA-binding domain-containing protein n=1 Tax=Marilutibacter penaei TaxID=2759900 RepID=A0A7W3U5J8_9GAMM|nr:putative DNA-binding domain-containing protein [Lysobacter penaei]MBB1089359.1 putative DNA-binding domain-containing protein [Lysobacter penaei]
MPDTAPARLREQQWALTRHLRDPDGQPAPADIEDRRLQVYRELLFNNVENLLSGNFPVIRRILGPAAWKGLVRAFFRDHRSRTPLFPELPREFLRFLESDPRAHPPWMPELAHYEWVELALQISDAELPVDIDPAGDLLAGQPRLSPLAWPLAYAWPVHRLGPGRLPEAPPEAPTLLLLRREPDGRVRFSELSPLAWRLLARLDAAEATTGRELLGALAGEAGVPRDAAFESAGVALLEQMRASGVVLGTTVR